MAKMCITDLDKEEFEEYCCARGMESYRARQILNWIYKRRVFHFSEMENLPGDLRLGMDEDFSILNMRVIDRVESDIDQSLKYLFELEDKQIIEGVYMSDKTGRTVCLSTQVGCPLQCRFCASGMVGHKRNLLPSEIVGQFLWMQKHSEKKVDRVVVMGMGEPFLNFDHLMRALHIIKASWGCGIGARKITVSTVGIVPRIIEFARLAGQMRLSVSLHAVDEEKRTLLMPINLKFGLKQLMESLHKYRRTTRRRISFEYVLIDGINDSDKDAACLAHLTKDLRHSINVIEYNKIDAASYQPSRRTVQFMQALKRGHVHATLRKSKGSDIGAACGQLSASMDRNE